MRQHKVLKTIIITIIIIIINTPREVCCSSRAGLRLHCVHSFADGAGFGADVVVELVHQRGAHHVVSQLLLVHATNNTCQGGKTEGKISHCSKNKG